MQEIKRLCWWFEGMSKHMLWMSVCAVRAHTCKKRKNECKIEMQKLSEYKGKP